MTAGKHIRRSVLLLRKVFHARFFLLGTAGRAAVFWLIFPFTLRSSYFAVCENLSAHNLQPCYETVFTFFKNKSDYNEYIFVFSAFLVYYNDTFIWKAFNLYIFPNHISFWLLFLWNPFHISYYTPSTLICQLVFCIICFLFFKAIWISWQFDKLPLYYSMYIHFFSFWKLAIYRHFDLLVSLLQKPKSVPGSISPCL